MIQLLVFDLVELVVVALALVVFVEELILGDEDLEHILCCKTNQHFAVVVDYLQKKRLQ